MSVDLKAKPFYLSDEDIAWVESTLASLTEKEKIQQLFCTSSMGDLDDQIALFDRIGFKPGGTLFRKSSAKELRDKVEKIQNFSKVPMLIAADLDRGSWNLIEEGTCNGHHMQIAATGDPEYSYKAGLLCARECTATGVNWDFGPVTDIDYNPYSPIVNVRSFGDKPEEVAEYTSRYCKGLKDGGMLACAKHWPGDGRDFRDQHFIASVNDLSVEEWDKTYGMIYGRLIDEGCPTVMTAHIMQPAYSRYYNPDIKDEEIMVGSLNYDLHNKLLRGKLGFNGLIVTDASSMVGFTERVPREKGVPMSIANGADMFLFNRNLEEDYEFMVKGYEEGVITPERLDEAVTRILATKAMLKLHEKAKAGTLVPPVEALEIFNDPAGKAQAREIADKSITLVRNDENVLPFGSNAKNIYVIVLGDKPGYHNRTAGYGQIFIDELKNRGFNVIVYDNDNPNVPFPIGGTKISELKKKIDVICYFANVETDGGDSAARITWPGVRNTIPTLIMDIPTILVSIDNPYHLTDAPAFKTLVNAYTSEENNVKMLVEKMCGDSPFKGISPIDPYKGRFTSIN
ncbi:MAG: glycoside hydrolase family 3 protein [Firmicutes bacterium]|nr:glycoside hydrolase family 3 protein [Bacillota bacterium]